MHLAQLFLEAVRRPHLVEQEDVDACLAGLKAAHGDWDTAAMGMRVVLAVAYTRPELLGVNLIDSISELLTTTAIPETSTSLVSDVLRGLVITPLGKHTVRAAEALLAQPMLTDSARNSLRECLEHVALWRRDLLDLATLVSLCEYEHLQTVAERIVTEIIEPVVLAQPAVLDDHLAHRLSALYARFPSPPYCLTYLAERPDVSQRVRAILRAATHDRFPLAGNVGQWLRHGPHHILLVHNVDDAQGDEMIRLVPLLQALLDCNPEIRATLLTKRRYLYAHPRLELVAIDHVPALHAAFQREFDIVISFFQPTLNFSRGIEAAIASYRSTHRPHLSLGCSNADEECIYDRLEIDGRPFAEERGLHCQRMRSVYETAFRLMAELGLPVRTGETAPDLPILAGIPCPEAEATWSDLMRRNQEGRPVALISPFGGHEALKGYVDSTIGHLVQRLRALIAEGFFLLILPNGEAWGTAEKVRTVLAQLDSAERRYATAGPDMLEHGGSAQCVCLDVPLQWRSLVMRHFLQFIRKSDLTIAVEGWAIHAAYLLGKPYRVLTLPYSVPEVWLPYGATRRQRIAEVLEIKHRSD